MIGSFPLKKWVGVLWENHLEIVRYVLAWRGATRKWIAHHLRPQKCCGELCSKDKRERIEPDRYLETHRRGCVEIARDNPPESGDVHEANHARER